MDVDPSEMRPFPNYSEDPATLIDFLETSWQLRSQLPPTEARAPGQPAVTGRQVVPAGLKALPGALPGALPKALPGALPKAPPKALPEALPEALRLAAAEVDRETEYGWLAIVKGAQAQRRDARASELDIMALLQETSGARCSWTSTSICCKTSPRWKISTRRSMG